MTDVQDAILAGIASGDDALEQMSSIITHLERAGFIIREEHARAQPQGEAAGLANRLHDHAAYLHDNNPYKHVQLQAAATLTAQAAEIERLRAVIPWDRTEGLPDVPVLQPRYDALKARAEAAESALASETAAVHALQEEAQAHHNELRTILDREAQTKSALARATEALTQCAAGWSSNPGTAHECGAEVTAEFQRRMEIAAAALTDTKGDDDAKVS